MNLPPDSELPSHIVRNFQLVFYQISTQEFPISPFPLSEFPSLFLESDTGVSFLQSYLVEEPSSLSRGLFVFPYPPGLLLFHFFFSSLSLVGILLLLSAHLLYFSTLVLLIGFVRFFCLSFCIDLVFAFFFSSCFFFCGISLRSF